MEIVLHMDVRRYLNVARRFAIMGVAE